jgi:hypothetical protein
MKNKKEVLDRENCYLIAAIRVDVILMESCAIVLLLLVAKNY